MIARASIVAGATLAMAAALGLRETTNVWATTGTVALLSLLACARLDGAHLRVLLTPGRRSLLLGGLAGLASVAVTWAGYRAMLQLLPEMEALMARFYQDLQDWPGPLLASPVILVVVLAEECVWRGLLVDLLGTSALAVAAAALAYALPQLLAGSPVLWAAALGCGLLWGWLRVRAGDLVAPLLAHAIWDAFVFVSGILR